MGVAERETRLVDSLSQELRVSQLLPFQAMAR